jgi:hypothetical protein
MFTNFNNSPTINSGCQEKYLNGHFLLNECTGFYISLIALKFVDKCFTMSKKIKESVDITTITLNHCLNQVQSCYKIKDSNVFAIDDNNTIEGDERMAFAMLCEIDDTSMKKIEDESKYVSNLEDIKFYLKTVNNTISIAAGIATVASGGAFAPIAGTIAAVQSLTIWATTHAIDWSIDNTLHGADLVITEDISNEFIAKISDLAKALKNEDKSDMMNYLQKAGKLTKDQIKTRVKEAKEATKDAFLGVIVNVGEICYDVYSRIAAQGLNGLLDVQDG